MNSRVTVKKMVRDRTFMFVWSIHCLLLLVLTIYINFQISPSELNVTTRYTSYGPTNLYNDSWYYLIGFVIFSVGMLVLHSLLAVKLYNRRGSSFARGFIGISIALAIIYFFVFSYVTRLASTYS